MGILRSVHTRPSHGTEPAQRRDTHRHPDEGKMFFFLCPLYRSRGFGQQTCAWRATPYPSRRDPSPSPVLQFTAGWSTRPLQFVLLELLR